MKLSIKVGSTSQTVNIFIQDSSSTTGAGLTGLVFDSSGLTAYYALPKAAAVSITLATLAAVTSAYSSGGFKEIDATNMPGWYRFDVPDAAIASGRFTSIHLKGATNMAPLPIEIELTGWDNQDGVRGGLTALPNAAAEAAGGLYTRGTGAGQIAQDANGNVRVNVDTIKTNPVVNGGTITFPTNATLASTTNITAGTITTATNLTTNNDKTGYALSAAGVQAIWDALSTALTTVGSIGKRLVDNLTGDIYARLGAPAGASVSADVAAVKVDTSAIKAKTDNLPASPAATSDIPSAAAITTAVLTTAMTEAYAADGAAPTLSQALFMLLGKNYEFAIVGDTLTVKKLDGSTTAMTFTLAPAGGPYTSITRAT